MVTIWRGRGGEKFEGPGGLSVVVKAGVAGPATVGHAATEYGAEGPAGGVEEAAADGAAAATAGPAAEGPAGGAEESAADRAAAATVGPAATGYGAEGPAGGSEEAAADGAAAATAGPAAEGPAGGAEESAADGVAAATGYRAEGSAGGAEVAAADGAAAVAAAAGMVTWVATVEEAGVMYCNKVEDPNDSIGKILHSTSLTVGGFGLFLKSKTIIFLVKQ